MADTEHPKITVEKREHLIKLISETIEKEGPNCNLNFIDVSHVTNMSHLFWKSRFNGDISQWDVPGDANMKLMFYGSPLELENRIPGWYK